MQARTICRTCEALLILRQEEDRWSLYCPKDGGFVNVVPGQHDIPASYADECQQRAAYPNRFSLTDDHVVAYEEAAALKRVYLQASSTAFAAATAD